MFNERLIYLLYPRVFCTCEVNNVEFVLKCMQRMRGNVEQKNLFRFSLSMEHMNGVLKAIFNGIRDRVAKDCSGIVPLIYF